MTPAIFGLSGLALTDDERDFFRDSKPAGYILFLRNCETREQVRALTDSLRDLHGTDELIVSIDQEGGRVARMKAPEWPKYPSGETFAKLWDVAPVSAIEAARVNAQALATDLAQVGITVNYHAPFDVRQPDTVDAIGDRALGSDGRQVAALGRAVLDGHARAGVLGCLKHMPGHGRARVDSHKDLPVVEASDEELVDDLRPFQMLNDALIGMSAHIVFTAWDPDNPATQSPTVIRDVIRDRIGFAGLLLSDDIDMEALSGTMADRSEKALEAGCDIILNCWAKMDDMTAIADRCPVMDRRSKERLDKVHGAIRLDTATADARELRAKRDALFAAAGLEVATV